jgi:thiol-disulfide isomerase/thioredoxin
MRKLIILTAVLAIFSCKNEPKVDYVLLSGKIENPKGDKVNITGNEFKHEIKLEKDGTFSDTLHIETAGYYSLNHGRERTALYTKAGDELKVTLDAAKFDETIQYEGKGAENNNYLASKFLANENFNFEEVYATEEADFLKTIGDAKTKSEEALSNAKDLNADFVEKEKKNINYEYLANLARYPRYHAYYAKKENFEPSEGLLADLDKLDYDNTEDFANSDSYKEIATGHHMDKVYKDSLIIENVSALKNLKSQNIKNELASQLTYFVSPSNKDAEKVYTDLMAISDSEDFKKKLTAKYDKVKNLIAGKASPKFDYENHKGGNTKLDDLKGKYVYIDVWATWCIPCLKEIPSLKKVEKKYHGKNIQFVSISIDKKKDYEKWRKMIKEKELSSIQLFADNDWRSQFTTDYSIRSIPRFIQHSTQP